MPQYYNGITKPAVYGLSGKMPYQEYSVMDIHMDLINNVFGGATNKVIFGFCISDCSATGSNTTPQKAAELIQ